MTVTRDVWQTAHRPDVSGIAVDARLFHEAGCRLVHRYRVYEDPFPHPALRGGGGGGECFLVCCPSWFGLWPSPNLYSSGFPFLRWGRRLARYQPIVSGWRSISGTDGFTFANSVTVLGDAPPPVHSPVSGAQELLRSAVAEEGETDTTDTPLTIIPPPPGFSQLSWP